MAEYYSDLLPIQQLSERHPGVTEAISAYYYEGAAICFARHFASPTMVEVTSLFQGENRVQPYSVTWETPTDQQKLAWANDDGATRDGAYAVALAAAESQLGLVAVGRSYKGSGS